MSDNTSTMNPTTDQIKALQAMDKTMRNLLAAFGVEGSVTAPAKKGRGRTKTAASSDTSAPAADTKPKREINPKIAEMNVERKAIYTEMVDAWKTANPEYANASKPDLTKAVADGKVTKPPSYPDALKEHSRRLNERDPERAAKRAADAKSKSDDKSSVKSDNNTTTLNDAASAGTTTDAPKKRRGPKALKDMTPEEQAAHKAKMAERKAAKNNTAAATSATSNAAPAPAPAPAPAATNSPVVPQPPKSTAPEIITGDDDDPETLKPWSFENTNYYKNDLGYVYEMNGDEPGDYIGRYTIKKGRKYIDTEVPEPGA